LGSFFILFELWVQLLSAEVSMILLVTISDGFLVCDSRSGESHCVHSGSGVYYGISYSSENIFVAARHLHLAAGDKEVATSRGTILVFDYSLKLIDEFIPPFPVRAIHQVLYAENRLLVTSSFDDMIAIKDDRGWSKWIPVRPRPWRDRNSGGLHFNSILFSSNRIYLLAHNFGRSRIYEFDGPSLALRHSVLLGSHAHNMWFEKDLLLTCSSLDQCIVSERGKVVHTGNYPRGIVVTREGSYVGISRVVGDRIERASQDCFIASFSPEWHLRGCFRLRGGGMVHDIRCPGERDASHPHLLGRELDLCYVRSHFPRVPMEVCDLPT
jgi:hypothetical protein